MRFKVNIPLYYGGNMIGIDILEVKRIKKLIENPEYTKRLFFKEEIDYANANRNPAIHFAGFFCVKESVVKALGGGLVTEIMVLHYDNGKPYVNLFGKAKELLGQRKIEISISHTDDYATAICQIVE